jgi:hypothetical protein
MEWCDRLLYLSYSCFQGRKCETRGGTKENERKRRRRRSKVLSLKSKVGEGDVRVGLATTKQETTRKRKKARTGYKGKGEKGEKEKSRKASLTERKRAHLWHRKQATSPPPPFERPALPHFAPESHLPAQLPPPPFGTSALGRCGDVSGPLALRWRIIVGRDSV